MLNKGQKQPLNKQPLAGKPNAGKPEQHLKSNENAFGRTERPSKNSNPYKNPSRENRDI